MGVSVEIPKDGRHAYSLMTDGPLRRHAHDVRVVRQDEAVEEARRRVVPEQSERGHRREGRPRCRAVTICGWSSRPR